MKESDTIVCAAYIVNEETNKYLRASVNSLTFIVSQNKSPSYSAILSEAYRYSNDDGSFKLSLAHPVARQGLELYVEATVGPSNDTYKSSCPVVWDVQNQFLEAGMNMLTTNQPDYGAEQEYRAAKIIKEQGQGAD
jgi:hypothetical protein